MPSAHPLASPFCHNLLPPAGALILLTFFHPIAQLHTFATLAHLLTSTCSYVICTFFLENLNLILFAASDFLDSPSNFTRPRFCCSAVDVKSSALLSGSLLCDTWPSTRSVSESRTRRLVCSDRMPHLRQNRSEQLQSSFLHSASLQSTADVIKAN